MALVKTPSGAYIERNLPLLDVETQIYMAEQSGQLSGPGYDIEALKAAGLVVPSSISPIGVQVAPDVQTGGWQMPGGISPDTGKITPIEWPKPSVDLPTEVIEPVIKEPLSPPSGGIRGSITIPLTQAELDRINAANAKPGCVERISVYKVGTIEDGVWVDVYVEATSGGMAKGMAKDAGYDVKQVTWSPTYEKGESKPVEEIVKVKDGQTGETIEFTQSGWDAWPDKYKKLVKTEGFDVAMREFKGDYYECADGQFILKTDFYALPTRYADIAATKGFSVMLTTFEADHVKLADGQYIPKKDWESLVESDKELGTNFTDIGQQQGYDAMVVAIDKANKPYTEFLKQVESGEIIPVANGQYITKAQYDKLPTGAQQIVKEQGFSALESATTLYWEKGSKPVGPSWDVTLQKRIEKWESLPQTITNAEWKKLPVSDLDMYMLDDKSAKRLTGLTLASFAPPAKAVLPEYTMADVTAMDWGIAAAQIPLLAFGFAPAAITGSLVGKAIVTGASTALGGMIGYETAKNWENLTPVQRGMGVGMAVLCAVPLLTTVARNVKISGPAIPIKEGTAVSWKGLSVAGNPIIGKSGGKWVLGTRGITLPEARLILDGYKPEMMLETKVFVNRAALEKAGFTKIQIDYLNDTLKSRNLFAGKSSPWLDKNVLIEPTQRLNASEINIIQQRLAQLKEGGLKDAYLLYGSPTIKAQAAPELRNWRPLHDWDISLNMNQAKTEVWAQGTLKDLQVKGGGIYRISSKTPTLIEKRLGNTWEHIADIHSQEVAITSAKDIPTSKLDATGAYSYGRMVAEPAVTVKYPGVGELRIMRLSESGVRKADTILRVRQKGDGTAFLPPERGIAQPGVPKDAADFYVILRTFRGEQIAEEWLESWAKAMGYSTTQLKTVLPKIRQSMLDVAAKTPSDIIGYEFKPASSARVASGASPAIIVHIPSSLGASVSSRLGSQISKPIYPYKLAQSPSIRTSTSLALSSMISKSPSVMASLAKTPSRSLASGKVLPSPSPAASKVPSLSPKPSASPIPSISPSGKPKPSGKASKAPSGVPSPKPSPSPVPSPKPSPYPSPYPRPQPKPKPTPKLVLEGTKRRYELPEGSIAWAMGKLKRKTGLKPQWYYIPPPWTQETPISLSYPPLGAKHAKETTPQKTIQMIGEPRAKVPKSVSIDLGVVDIFISDYGKSIRFTGHGEETKVGKSLNIPTRGMSIPATAPMRVAKFKRRGNGHKVARKSERVVA